MKDKEQPAERPTPKLPIYPVAVIEVACRALQAVVSLDDCGASLSGPARETVNRLVESCLSIVSEGLEDHRRAIRGES